VRRTVGTLGPTGTHAAYSLPQKGGACGVGRSPVARVARLGERSGPPGDDSGS